MENNDTPDSRKSLPSSFRDGVGDRGRTMKWAKRLFQLLIAALVVWGIWHSFEKAQAELARHKFEWSQIRPLWLVASGAIYFVGTLPSWWFWHLTLNALGQQPRPATSLRAYTIGQLGKYVPGKALVVVLRASWVSGPKVDWFMAAAAVFVETLTMISVGAALSGILLLVLFPEMGSHAANFLMGKERMTVHAGLLLAAVALSLVSWLPTIPSVFRLLVARLLRRSASQLHTALNGVNRSLILRGWIMMPLNWLMMGLSLWAVAQAIPGADPGAVLPSVRDLGLHIACISLAVVLGFASFIPGGFGVRELVVTTVLAPHPDYGPARALVVAILLRIVWLLSELFVSAILVASARNRPAHVLKQKLSPSD